MFFTASFLTAQQSPSIQYEYGSPAELKGVTKIFVYTGPEWEVRNNIVKTIRGKLKDLVIADHPEDADVVLAFGADARTFLSGVHRSGTTVSTGTVDINARRSVWMKERFESTYGRKRRKISASTNYKCSSDTRHFEWLTVTEDRFERFTVFKPPALPEVPDF